MIIAYILYIIENTYIIEKIEYFFFLYMELNIMKFKLTYYE